MPGDKSVIDLLREQGMTVAPCLSETHVASFTVRMSDGLDATFVPADGVLFDDTAPIDHLRDHLANGDRVRVEYETLADGTKSAVAVGDE